MRVSVAVKGLKNLSEREYGKDGFFLKNELLQLRSKNLIKKMSITIARI